MAVPMARLPLSMSSNPPVPQKGNGMSYAAMRGTCDYLAERFAHTITGPYKQDISMLLQGPKGSGKSYASLRIAYNTARCVAEILDDDWHKWTNYFSMNNVAIIDPDRAFEIIGEAKAHNVYLFDDIGVGWNSRSFASKDNRDKNDIFQINRVAQTVQILSMPNQFLLDKVPRMLCNYMAEMDRSEYSRGFSLMKVFKTKTLFRLNNQRITPHLVAEDGAKITKYVVHRPPKFLAKQYDKIRNDVTRRIISERAQQGEEEKPAPGPRSTSDMYDRARSSLPKYEQCRLIGMAHKEALNEIGVPDRTWYRWKTRGVLKDLGYGGD